MSEYKRPSEFWRLSETVSVIEATLLTLDIEPQSMSQYVEGWDDDRKPEGYVAVRNALIAAIKSGVLAGEIIYPAYEDPETGDIEPDYSRTNFHTSLVNLTALANWLMERDYFVSFFTYSRKAEAGFRDKSHPRYSAKLAAVVEAWEAFDEESGEPGTVKQRIEKWLRLNAARFGLTNDDGNPSETVIKSLATVANWATGGGAPKQSSDESEGF